MGELDIGYSGGGEDGSSEEGDPPLPRRYNMVSGDMDGDNNKSSMGSLKVDKRLATILGIAGIFRVENQNLSDDVNVAISKAWQKTRTEYYPPGLTPPPEAVGQMGLATAVRQRGTEIVEAGRDMVNYFRENGEDINRVKTLEIIVGQKSDRLEKSGIMEYFNRIASSQLEKFVSGEGSKSWEEYDPEAAEGLRGTITSYFEDESYSTFWQGNPEFRKSLEEIVKLTRASSYQEAKEIYLELEDQAKLALINNRKCYVNFAMDDYYLDPNRGVDQEPTSWEAQLQLLFSPSEEVKKLVNNLYEDAEQRMAGRFNTKADAPSGKPLIGYFVIGAGTEDLSATVGQANIGERFTSALNLMKKNEKAWEKTQKIFNESDNFEEVERVLFYLLILHEIGHEKAREATTSNSGDTRILDELKTDAPSVGSLIDKAMEDYGGDERLLKSMVCAIVTTYAMEAAITFEEGGDVAMGYTISSNFILNSLIEEGIISRRAGKDLVLDVDASREKIEAFRDKIAEVHKVLNPIDGAKSDPSRLEELKNVEANDTTSEIVDYYRKF